MNKRALSTEKMFYEAGDHNDRTAVEKDCYSKTLIIAGRAEYIRTPRIQILEAMSGG